MAEKSPVEWALTPLKKYAQFSGRAPRAEYWWFTLANVIVSFVVGFLDGALGMASGTGIGAYGLLSIVYTLALLIPGIAVTIRRLHDTDRTGWWLLAPIIPYSIGVAMMMPALLDPTTAATAGAASLGGGAIVMIIGAILALVLFVFMVLPGTSGPNRYGPDPYGADVEQVFA